MVKILIVYHSRTGNTAQMAGLVTEGARQVSGVEVTVRPLEEASVDDLLEYDGIIVGSPVYFATIAAEMKSFIDQSVKHYGRLVGKVGGAFASTGEIGGGVETTIMDILRTLLIHGMVVQGALGAAYLGAVSIGAPEDERARKDCVSLGKRVAELAVTLAASGYTKTKEV